jgi:glutamyl-tRNA synthetase
VQTVRVRFAPSPTGYLHVGGLRTALYNYLFARKNNGVFLLRIEDTDRSRYVEGAVEGLIETLRWAGLDYDEGPLAGGDHGPYKQSERLPLYREHAESLVKEGKAYYAFETAEELEEIRRSQEKGLLTRELSRRALEYSQAEVKEKLAAGIPAVIRMKMPDSGMVRFHDIVRGPVEFSGDVLDDQVLLKSDGYPTYHLANVVDDHTMGITHIIRGEEWLSSTPKHVLLYRYFGWEMPAFAHLPLLLNPDRSKLSKRQGDVAVEEYRRKGFLPEALLNFVAFLGWNPGDEREFFTLPELVREFSLERVGKSGAVFDVEKLRWMNTQHLRRKSDSELLALVRPYFDAAGYAGVPDSYLLAVCRLLKERVETPQEFVSSSPYFFNDPQDYDEVSRKKNWRVDTPEQMRQVRAGLAALPDFTHDSIEAVVRTVAERNQIGAGKIIHPLRLAVTGRSQGPGLFELMGVVGRDTCLRRIDRAVDRLQV